MIDDAALVLCPLEWCSPYVRATRAESLKADVMTKSFSYIIQTNNKRLQTLELAFSQSNPSTAMLEFISALQSTAGARHSDLKPQRSQLTYSKPKRYEHTYGNCPSTLPGGLYLHTIIFEGCEKIVPAPQFAIAQATCLLPFHTTCVNTSIYMLQNESRLGGLPG